MRLANSGSFFKLRRRFLISHSGKGLALFDPDIVYTGTVAWLLGLILGLLAIFKAIKT